MNTLLLSGAKRPPNIDLTCDASLAWFVPQDSSTNHDRPRSQVEAVVRPISSIRKKVIAGELFSKSLFIDVHHINNQRIHSIYLLGHSLYKIFVS